MESTVFENFKSGNWSFDKGNQILILRNNIETEKWKLERVNDFGMVLINIETTEKWIFASK